MESELLQTSASLRRILTVLEEDKRRGRLELAIAIVLSLATLGSTWCGYQAQLWGSRSSAEQAAADTAERQAAEGTIVGLQLRNFDGTAMLQYWAAMREHDAGTQEAVFSRMRPQLQKAIQAALAAGVLNDPRQPGPLQRPEYVLSEEVEARRLRDEASERKAAAQVAGNHSSSYILLTLMFASVLFFGGITGTFTSRPVRLGLGCVSLILFVGTMIFLVGLPVCRS
jgi:hypothetical protein